MSIVDSKSGLFYWVLALLIGAVFCYSRAIYELVIGTYHQTVLNSSHLSFLVFSLTAVFLWQISKRPSLDLIRYVIPVTAILYALAILAVLLLRIDYSRSTILLSAIPSALVLVILSRYVHLKDIKNICLIPNFDTSTWVKNKKFRASVFSEPVLPEFLPDAVAVDLHTDLNGEWQRLIADLSLHKVPVYHVAALEESLSGRVDTTYLHENSVGNLLVDSFYEKLKRFTDIMAVVLLLPIVFPLVMLFLFIIRAESSGSPFFYQDRVGQGGKTFRLWKLRSMAQVNAEEQAKFATDETHRITKVGAFIRKCRIDELPQLWNVLKGDMSLIGPRPEQPSFVEQFNQQIPFYSYRHVVKPGITGWAQVEQGYADCEDSTAEKLSYDLFYIKNFSFWLDAVIVLKTLKTILTGFGAK
jgi:lipopolysaccharide/colanic/teichoic acid biosynthesis glycosyltransferase